MFLHEMECFYTISDVVLIDYLEEQSIVVAKYKRARKISFENPRDELQYIHIQEEEVANDVVEPGSQVNMYIPVANVAGVPLINPVTGESLGVTMSVMEIHTILYSMYAYMRDPTYLASNSVDQDTIDQIVG